MVGSRRGSGVENRGLSGDLGARLDGFSQSFCGTFRNSARRKPAEGHMRHYCWAVVGKGDWGAQL